MALQGRPEVHWERHEVFHEISNSDRVLTRWVMQCRFIIAFKHGTQTVVLCLWSEQAHSSRGRGSGVLQRAAAEKVSHVKSSQMMILRSGTKLSVVYHSNRRLQIVQYNSSLMDVVMNHI